MLVKDDNLLHTIERLSDHYKTNISNRVLRPVLLKMDLNNTTWERIERLTEITPVQRNEGYSFEELYEQVLAMALFVNYAQHRILPSARALLGNQVQKAANPNDKVLREMAINNLAPNLGILSDIVNDLYLKTVELDKKYAGNGAPVYTKMPELKQLGQLLT